MNKAKELSPDVPIVVELNHGECYTGSFKCYNEMAKYIEVTNVSEVKSGKKLRGSLNFYESELKSIRTLKKDANNADARLSAEVAVQSTSISLPELKRIEDQISNFVYISQCDQAYHNALDDLKCQEFIGVSLEGSRFGRLKKASLLSVSTVNKIYIFDLLFLGKIFPEMKEIFENPLPRKILHDSCYITDYLKHQERCELNGIFDTMVAHFLIKKNKKIVTLQNCLEEYLDLPGKFIYIPKISWTDRPLTEEIQTFAACNVAFLIKLYLYMAHDILLRPLNNISQKYASVYSQNNDQVDVFHKMTTHKNPGIDDIDVDSLKDLSLADSKE